MKRLALALAGALIAGTALAADRDVAPPPPTLAVHNGSLMEIIRLEPLVGPHTHVQIRYRMPAEHMMGLVGRGTLLVDGVWTGDTGFEGTAYVFYAACPPAPYHVSAIDAGEGGQLVLHGAAPIVNEWDCTLLGYDPHNFNSTLVFRPL